MRKLLFILSLLLISDIVYAKGVVVLLSDFGLRDAGVAAMKAVSYSVDTELVVTDLSHDINTFDINHGGYVLHQAMKYYPKGSVFVCVVDPGVGTSRKSVVAKTKDGYYIVTPDNGLLTYVNKYVGLEEIREIDLSINSINNLTHCGGKLDKNTKEKCTYGYTFHGRDVFSYTGARLASGAIDFTQIGKKTKDIILLNVPDPLVQDGVIYGDVLVLDGAFGNLWTNVTSKLLDRQKISSGDKVLTEIFDKKGRRIYKKVLTFASTFGDVREGDALLYINSLGNLAIGINQGDFSKKYDIQDGFELSFRKV